jgi:hypothetical protein
LGGHFVSDTEGDWSGQESSFTRRFAHHVEEGLKLTSATPASGSADGID